MKKNLKEALLIIGLPVLISVLFFLGLLKVHHII